MIINSKEIKAKALQSGFDLVGITNASLPINEVQNINEFIEKKYHGTMEWFVQKNEIRTELKNLGLEPKSVIVLGKIYRNKEYEEVLSNSKYKISRYAIGKDYHIVLRNKAKNLIDCLRLNFPKNKFRQSVDTLPVPEKVFAKLSGIGWQGKHTNIIHEKKGSFFFLSTILTDLELNADSPSKDRCGTCRKCIDACPTNAILEIGYKIDARKCISYLTIENKIHPLPEEFDFKGWVYGCDICQEICPWNRPNSEEKFTEDIEFQMNPKLNCDLAFLNESGFQGLIKDSAMSRISYEQWKRNINS